MMTTKKASDATCSKCCSGVCMFFSLLATAVVLGVIVVGGLYWVGVKKMSCTSNETMEETNGEIATLQSDLDALQARLDGVVQQQDETKIMPVVSEKDKEDSDTTSSNLAVSKYPFSVLDIEVGDALGDFTVKSIKPYSASEDLSDNNASVRLTGQATLTGRYQYYGSTSPLAGQVCITDLDDESATLLPNIKDRDSVVVCFTNNDVAQQLFGPKGSVGNATFTIDDYTINVGEDEEEVTDMSTLVKATKNPVE